MKAMLASSFLWRPALALVLGVAAFSTHGIEPHELIWAEPDRILAIGFDAATRKGARALP